MKNKRKNIIRWKAKIYVYIGYRNVPMREENQTICKENYSLKSEYSIPIKTFFLLT